MDSTWVGYKSVLSGVREAESTTHVHLVGRHQNATLRQSATTATSSGISQETADQDVDRGLAPETTTGAENPAQDLRKTGEIDATTTREDRLTLVIAEEMTAVQDATTDATIVQSVATMTGISGKIVTRTVGVPKGEGEEAQDAEALTETMTREELLPETTVQRETTKRSSTAVTKFRMTNVR